MASSLRLLAPRALRAAAGVAVAASGWASSSSSSRCDAPSSASASSSSAASKIALSPAEFRPFRLLAREQLTPDTSRYSFALPSESAELGLPVAACLTVRVPDPADPAKFVIRPYTPVSAAGARGAFELVVKTYEPGGKASKAFDALKVGDSLEMKGPFVKFVYEPNAQAAIAMVAGGTGIAPMVQLLRAILDNPRDRTEVRLVYASKTPADVILKAELDALALTHPNFKVLYTVRGRKRPRRGPADAGPPPPRTPSLTPLAPSASLRVRPGADPAGQQGARGLGAVAGLRRPRDQGDARLLPAAARGGRRRQGRRVRAAGLHEGRERREEEPERPGRARGHAQGPALLAQRGVQVLIACVGL